MPQIVILAGPNGAGKSTLAARFVPPGVPFLNADNIARSLTPAPGQNANITAGRLLLARTDESVQVRTSFALETNFANCTLATRIPRWQQAGYAVSLVFSGYPVRTSQWNESRHEFAAAVTTFQQRPFVAGIKLDCARSSRCISHLSIAGGYTITRTLSGHHSSLMGASGSRKLGTASGRHSTMATANSATQLAAQEDTLEALFGDDDRLDYLAQVAVRDALREHKRLGQSVVVWQDGKVVTLAP